MTAEKSERSDSCVVAISCLFATAIAEQESFSWRPWIGPLFLGVANSEIYMLSNTGTSLLRQLEAREWLGFALNYVVEPVFPGVGLGVVDESVAEAGLTVRIGENESKLIFFRRGNPDGLRRGSAVEIHPHTGVLLGLIIPADEYGGFVLRFAFVVLLPRDFLET